MTILEIKHLYFNYGNTELLRDINLSLNQNEKVAVLGPNGCGKTTLLRLISCYLAPLSGEIFLKGKPINDYTIKERAKIVAMLHQSSTCSFGFTVDEVVRMGRYPFLNWNGSLSSNDVELVNNSIKLMDIEALKKKSVLNISGGERQRTMTARTFAQNPELVLMDEPVNALDIKHQLHLMSIVKRDTQRTYLTVMHDINLASAYTNRIILMKDGAIIDDGPPETVINEDNIKRVYEIDSDIIIKNGRPYIFPYE